MRKLKLEELGRVDPTAYADKPKLPVCLILDDIRSMHNVGSAFRTADAFSLEKIYLGGITARPPHREIHKTALGAEDTVQWKHVADVNPLITQLKNEGYVILAIEQTDSSIPLQEYNIMKGVKYALVFGNEVNGVSEGAISLVNGAIEIPQTGTKHSLNISVCLGIVSWRFFDKLFLFK